MSVINIARRYVNEPGSVGRVGPLLVQVGTRALVIAGNTAWAAVRERLVASGLVRAVIALPGRIFLDGRPPSSLVVLERGARPLAQTLFIDLQESGRERVSDGPGDNRPVPGAGGGSTERTERQPQAIPGADPEAAPEYAGRTLPPEVVAEALERYRHFGSSPADLVAEPGYSAIAGAGDLEANGCLLTPWTYVHHRAPEDGRPMYPSAQALMAYARLRQATHQELDDYLAGMS